MGAGGRGGSWRVKRPVVCQHFGWQLFCSNGVLRAGANGYV